MISRSVPPAPGRIDLARRVGHSTGNYVDVTVRIVLGKHLRGGIILGDASNAMTLPPGPTSSEARAEKYPTFAPISSIVSPRRRICEIHVAKRFPQIDAMDRVFQSVAVVVPGR